MQSLILPGAFLSLPYILYAVAQAVRGQFRVGKWGTSLAYVAVIVPITMLALDSININSQPLLTAAILANAVIVLAISAVLLVMDMRRPQRDLNHSLGVLGLGVGSLLIIGMFTTPVILSQFPDSAAPTRIETATGRVARSTEDATNAPADRDSNSAVSPNLDTDADFQAILETATGLAFENILSQIDEGTSLAGLVELGGGDMDVVMTAITETLEQGIAEGAVPQRILEQFGSDAASLAAQMVNGELPSQVVTRIIGGILPSGDIDTAVPGGRGSRPGDGETGAARDQSATIQDIEREDGALPTVEPTQFNAETSTQVDAFSVETIYVSTFDGAQHAAGINSEALSSVDSAIELVSAIGPREVEATVIPVIKTCLVTVNYNLNLRAGPSTEDEWLLTIPYTSVIQTTGQNSEGWWLVSYAGQSGWVSGEYLTASPSCSTLPMLP